jgi:uncharacterized protein DUF6101
VKSVRNKPLKRDLTTLVRLSPSAARHCFRMVSQLAEPLVASSLKSLERLRIEAWDPRSDNGRRVVDLAREAVIIRRAVAGVPMAIRIASRAYRGVALRITGLEDGCFHYQVTLLHSDPDLSVPLAEGDDQATAEAQWRDWVGFLGLPAFGGRTDSGIVQVNIGGVDLARRLPSLRRRGRIVTRRPRFLTRRKVGGPVPARTVCADPRVLSNGSKLDR